MRKALGLLPGLSLSNMLLNVDGVTALTVADTQWHSYYNGLGPYCTFEDSKIFLQNLQQMKVFYCNIAFYMLL